MKKITMATIKSFVKKNHGNLFIKVESTFNGMIDGCDYDNKAKFEAVWHGAGNLNNTLGVHGAWFVRGNGDLLKAYSDGIHSGYEVNNCCGSFILTTMAVYGSEAVKAKLKAA